jgi:hypothetical protein
MHDDTDLGQRGRGAQQQRRRRCRRIGLFISGVYTNAVPLRHDAPSKHPHFLFHYIRFGQGSFHLCFEATNLQGMTHPMACQLLPADLHMVLSERRACAD